MITRFGMAPRLPASTIEQFQEHWRTSHAAAASQIPGARSYIQNHGVLRGGAYLLGYPGFDACSQLEFDSVESMEAGFASEQFQVSVQADEREFVDKTRFSLLIAQTRMVSDGPELAVKVLSFYRAHPVGGAELVATLTGERAGHLHGLVDRLEVYPVDPDGHRATPACADAAEVLWFESIERLETATTTTGWARAELALAGRAYGRARLVAEPIRVL